MLKTLLKKQMAEIFRNYFYDPKKNKMRSRGARSRSCSTMRSARGRISCRCC